LVYSSIRTTVTKTSMTTIFDIAKSNECSSMATSINDVSDIRNISLKKKSQFSHQDQLSKCLIRVQ